jgi:hypothetical protein
MRIKKILILSSIFFLVFGLTATIFVLSSYGTELLPPLDVNLTMIDPSPSLGDTVTIVLDFIVKDVTPKPNILKANISFQSRNLEIMGESSFVLDNVPLGVNKTIEVPIRISGSGKAILIALVRIVNDKDEVLFSNSASLYFLVFTDKVFVGKNSFVELEINKLKEDYQKGLITKEEFNKKMQEASKGKGIETIKGIQ